MEPFTDRPRPMPSLPSPGRLKCVWVPGADGRLESIWVPDWERELAEAEASRRPAAGSAAA